MTGISAARQGVAGARRGVVAWRRRLAWRHPEWWALGVALAAWAVLIGTGPAGAGAPNATAHLHHAVTRSSVLTGAAHWQLMVLAMMLPLVVPALRVVAFRSLWRRRQRAMAGFLIGYLALWALVGLAVSTLLVGVPALVGEWRGEVVATSFLIAAGWVWMPVRRRALVACHRTLPLAPSGARADRDCVRFGWEIGQSCGVSCWALMVACTLTGHSVVALVACGWIGLVERYAWRPNTWLISFSLVALGAGFWFLGRP